MPTFKKKFHTAIIILFLISVLACRLPFFQQWGSDAEPTLTVTPRTQNSTATSVPLATATQPFISNTPQPTQTQPIPELSKTPLLSKADRDRHKSIFRYVWRTVNQHYVYPSFNGTDWAAVREEFEPRIASARDDEHFWQLMSEMIERLRDDHSAYLTPEEVAQEDQAMRGNLDYVGIGVYVTIPKNAEYAVVLFPIPGGPAEMAGVRAHDRILEINGLKACCNDDGYDNLDKMLGPEGSKVTLLVQQPSGVARQVIIQRARIQTQLPVLSRIITSTVQSSKRVGYVLIPTLWDETIAERTREVLQELLGSSEISGLIIDMRINGGGAYTELYDLLSIFTQGDVGGFYQRDRIVENLDITPDSIASSQDIPMIVLVGNATESYAEVFAGVLQAQGRAKLVGEPTAGNVETVYPYDLEDGSRLWLAQETFVIHGQSSWEDKGVQPDITISGRWEDITDEDDPAIDTAVAVLMRDA